MKVSAAGHAEDNGSDRGHRVSLSGLTTDADPNGDREIYSRIARHAAFGERALLLDALLRVRGPANALLATLKTHHLARLVVDAATPAEIGRALPPPHADVLLEWYRRPVTSNRTRLSEFDEIRQALEGAGVPVLVLKGFPFATRLYGHLERRHQHDIDLLVHRTDLSKAASVFARLGFARLGVDRHAATFGRGDLRLDVHWCLRRIPAIPLDTAPIWRDAIECSIDGVLCRTLSDEWSLVLLALSNFEDLGHGYGRLRSLADLALLLRLADRSMDWERFFGTGREGLAQVSANVFAIAAALFETQTDHAALTSALDRRQSSRAPIGPTDDQIARLDLVFAPPLTANNLRWFGRVYPGSLARYMTALWLGGLPGNLSRIRPRRLVSASATIWRIGLDRLRDGRS